MLLLDVRIKKELFGFSVLFIVYIIIPLSEIISTGGMVSREELHSILGLSKEVVENKIFKQY